MSDNNHQALPFFVRFLEGQCEDLSAEEMDQVQGGLNLTNFKLKQKHPPENIVVSNKHLADQLVVEHSRGFITNAYPSDREGPGGY